jgi:hypothetical protein
VVSGALHADGPNESGREELSAQRPEAWAMRYFAAALQSTGVSAPLSRPRGAYEIGLENGAIPRLSKAQRMVGFEGTKEEDLNRSPVLIRPHAAVGLGGDFSLVADWLPPVSLDRARAEVVTVALERPLVERETWSLGARIGAGSGNILADVTCPQAAAAAGDNPALNPNECQQASKDRQSFHWKSAELVVAGRLTPALSAYASASVWKMDGLFRVNALDDEGADRDRLAFTGADRGGAVGLDWSRGLWDVGVEAFLSPLDVIRDPAGRGPSQRDDFRNLRLRISYKFR